MLLGYARVSTDDQDTAAQVAALKAAGCERIFREKASGGRWDRPELHRLLDHDAARLFNIHPATVSRLLAQARVANAQKPVSSRNPKKA